MLVEKSKMVVSPATLDKYIAPKKRQYFHVPAASVHYLNKKGEILHNHNSENLPNQGRKENFLNKVK